MESIYSKENIKNRMIKRIAALWDMQSFEHMDPIVKLLIESLSEEIFMVAGEMSNLDDRLLDKMTSALTPAYLLTARPAHAILSAQPAISAILPLDEKTIFSYRDQAFLRKHDINDLSFNPIVPFTLVKARVSYAIIENSIYQIDKQHHRGIPMYAQSRDPKYSNVVWLGVNVDESVELLDNLPFYIDFPRCEDKEKYLRLLPHTKWSLNGENLPMSVGFQPTERSNYNNSATEGILSNIISVYEKHYITLSQPIKPQAEGVKRTLPKELDTSFDENIHTFITESVVWIRIDFPIGFSREVLEYIRIGLNLFPAVNKATRSVSMKMDGTSLFVPLSTDNHEYFLDIESVSDTSGKEYKPFAVDEYSVKDTTKGVYYIRRGGVEQFSRANDAKSTMLRLVDVLRSVTSVSNNRAEKDFSASIDSLLRDIDKFSKKIEALPGRTDPKSYITIDKTIFGEILMVKYLITNGDIINKLRAGTQLVVTENDYVFDADIFMLTAPHGGQAPPSTEKIRDTHRYMITSHDRIFTKHDILNFCKAEYGESIETMEVKAGYGISRQSKKGMVKTIDIHISLCRSAEYDICKDELKHELLNKLESRSPDSFNYRLFIN